MNLPANLPTSLPANLSPNQLAHLPANLFLPTNRLRCTDCKSYRPIIEFPFDHSFRRTTYAKCKTQYTNRREVQDQWRQLRIEKEQVGKEQVRQRHDALNEAARACGMPKRCWDYKRMSCYCERLLELVIDPQLREEPLQERLQDEDLHEDP